ncbi:shikimate dehydrogenase [Eubacteriaceae bacterium ES3]|nr:shikimate dehydrogenase [Eubacteriaceae bacterium ES3]
MMNISVNTRIFAVLGEPIGQSLSPLLHNTLFKEHQIDGVYFPIEVSSQNLADLIKGFRLMNFGGFNITKPHKLQVMDSLDAIDPLARKIGAVNTVVYKDGIMTGYNTDGFGFIRSIENKLETVAKEDLTVLILGCGGAVKSVAMALADWGVKKIVIANRTLEKAQTLCSQINEGIEEVAFAVKNDPVSLAEICTQANLIVNGTSLGMSDSIDQTPLNKELIRPGILVYDMIYSPEKTRFLKEAEEQGALIENGLDMLLFQGLLAFELWTGIFPDPELGRKVLQEGTRQ